jgi:hypothetical protein
VGVPEIIATLVSLSMKISFT